MSDNSLRKQNAAKLSVVSNTSLTLIKLITGIFTGSVGILSEAIHSAMDLVASCVAYVSIKAASEPADSEHPYGHGKYEEIAGLAEASLIFIAVVIIVYESVTKLLDLQHFEIQTEIAFVVMLLATITNIIVSKYLFKVARETDSMALYADAQHLMTDVYTSAGILVSLIIIKITGYTWVDPFAALCVAMFISYIAYKISKRAINNLIDVSLPEEEEDRIKEIVCRYSDEIIGVHKFKTRKSGSSRFIEFHMILDGDITIQQGHLLCDLIEEDIEKEIPKTYISIHMEPCINDCGNCDTYRNYPDSCNKTTKVEIQE